ncbi:MAG: hypothetical protein WCI00_09660 [bacterium]
MLGTFVAQLIGVFHTITGGLLSTTQGNGTNVYVPLVIPVRISFELINHQITAPSSVLSGLNTIPDQFLSVRRRLVEMRFVSVLNLNVSIGAIAVELCHAGVFPYALYKDQLLEYHK